MTRLCVVAGVAWMISGSLGSVLAAGCGDAPIPPKLPDGATAKGDEMAATSEAMEAYSAAMGAWRECTIASVNTVTESYGTTVKAWQVERAAYQARGAKKKK